MYIKLGSVGSAVKSWQEFLTEKCFFNGSIDSKFGPKTKEATIEFQKNYGLDPDGIVGPATKAKAIELGYQYPVLAGDVTTKQLMQIMPDASDANINKYCIALNQAMRKYDINTYLRQAHFIAQIAHESGSFRYKEEIASGEAYENRADLGNIYPGDGKKFKGRGLIQLTGRNNYTEYGNDIGINLVDEPQKVAEDPALCVDVAGWYWMKRKINLSADNDDIISVTKKINGGTNGLSDRKQYLSRAINVLKCDVPAGAIKNVDDFYDKIKSLKYNDWKGIFHKHLEWSEQNNRTSGSPVWHDEEKTINVIGIRCNSEVDFNLARYNDYLIIIFNKTNDDFSQSILEVTADPATDGNRRAHLRQGVWNAYVVRKHIPASGIDERVFPVIGRQKRWAIGQDQNKSEVEVVRTDGRGNVISTERGRFGINIHDNGGYRDSSIGCTVIKNDESYVNLFLPYIFDIQKKDYVPINKNNITYCLINQKQFLTYL